MAKRGRRQPPIKTKRTLTPQAEVFRLLVLVRVSLQSIMGQLETGRMPLPTALETVFLYGLGQGIRVARQDMKTAKALEKGVDEIFGESQQEVDVKGKSMEEAEKEIKKAVDKDQRPTIWTPEGER